MQKTLVNQDAQLQELHKKLQAREEHIVKLESDFASKSKQAALSQLNEEFYKNTISQLTAQNDHLNSLVKEYRSELK